MAAMRAASESAEEMIGDLTVEYNRTRQGQITTELAEIIGGAAALE
jgi:F-type H+-transporting ATPase subunit gamma